MFRFDPEPSVFHAFDPRAKLFLQIAVAIASVAIAGPSAVIILCGLATVSLWLVGVSVREFLGGIRFVLALLGMAVLVRGITIGAPWIDTTAALDGLEAALRILLLVAVGFVYVRTTPIRESQAALQWFVPGRIGRLLAVGVGVVFRFFPVLLSELQAMRTASQARLGDKRPVQDRIGLLTIGGVNRGIERADRLSDALRARCLAWNPTLPPLAASRHDVIPIGLGVALLGWTLLAG